VRGAADRPRHAGALGLADPCGAAAGVALADADLFARDAHPIDGTGPTVNIGTMVSGGTAIDLTEALVRRSTMA
jgi:hypothetical protein